MSQANHSEFKRIAMQIEQDVNDEKDEAVYCPSEIKGILDLYELEGQKRDRTIAQQKENLFIQYTEIEERINSQKVIYLDIIGALVDAILGDEEK